VAFAPSSLISSPSGRVEKPRPALGDQPIRLSPEGISRPGARKPPRLRRGFGGLAIVSNRPIWADGARPVVGWAPREEMDELPFPWQAHKTLH